MQEKRRAPRYVLDPNTGTLSLSEGYRHLVIVRNVSATGMMLELSLEESLDDLSTGDVIMLETPPSEVGETLANRQGVVRWIDGERFGVEFTEPVERLPELSPLINA